MKKLKLSNKENQHYWNVSVDNIFEKKSVTLYNIFYFLCIFVVILNVNIYIYLFIYYSEKIFCFVWYFLGVKHNKAIYLVQYNTKYYKIYIEIINKYEFLYNF